MTLDRRLLLLLGVAVGALVLLVARIGGLGGLWQDGDGAGPGAGRPEESRSEGPAASRTPPPGLEGMAPNSKAVVTTSLPPPVDLDACDRNLDLFGVVVTRDGKPVVGADLRVVTYPFRRANLLDHAAYFRVVEGPGTRSAADGTFSIRLRRGEHVTLRASAEGYATFERPRCVAGQRLRLVLPPGVTLVVRLKDEAGAPVADTPVRVFRAEHRGGASFERRMTSDGDGRARFEGLPGGVDAWVDPEPVRLGQVGWETVDLPAEGEATVEIVLPAGRTITGRVTDADTKAPVAGARVGISWVLSRSVTTNADGRYEITGWNERQGASDLHAVAAGYGRQSADVGSRDVVDFALEPGDTVVGRAVDAGGKPVGGAVAAVVPSGPRAGRQGSDINGATETDAEGRFRLGGLRRDQVHALVLMAPGFGRTVLDFAPREGGAGEIDLGDVVLPPARAIEGRVLYGHGAPAADVNVSLSGANADRRRLLPPLGPDAGGSSYGVTEESRSDDLGRFRFPDLSPGEYALKASPDRGERVSRTVVLTPGEDLRGVELVLAATREVVVHVRDPAGAPVRAYVSANILNRRVSAQTGVDGDARLSLTAEAWTVQVSVPPREAGSGDLFLRPVPRTVGASDLEVTFVLERAEPILGFVRDPAGKAVEGAVVEALVGERSVDTGMADGNGAFRVLVPAGARVDLRVSQRQEQRPAANGAVAVSIADWTGTLTGVEAGARDVEIRARPTEADASISVRVLDPSASPVSGARVSASAAGSSAFESTQADGTATLRASSSLRYEVFVSPPDAAGGLLCSERLKDVVPDGRPLAVRLREGTPVSGSVIGPDGKALAGAAVEAYLAGGRWVRFARTDAQGRFRIALDAAVDFPVTLRARVQSGSAMSEGSLELKTPPTSDVEIRLREVSR